MLIDPFKPETAIHSSLNSNFIKINQSFHKQQDVTLQDLDNVLPSIQHISLYNQNKDAFRNNPQLSNKTDGLAIVKQSSYDHDHKTFNLINQKVQLKPHTYNFQQEASKTTTIQNEMASPTLKNNVFDLNIDKRTTKNESSISSGLGNFNLKNANRMKIE